MKGDETKAVANGMAPGLEGSGMRIAENCSAAVLASGAAGSLAAIAESDKVAGRPDVASTARTAVGKRACCNLRPMVVIDSIAAGSAAEALCNTAWLVVGRTQPALMPNSSEADTACSFHYEAVVETRRLANGVDTADADADIGPGSFAAGCRRSDTHAADSLADKTSCWHRIPYICRARRDRAFLRPDAFRNCLQG